MMVFGKMSTRLLLVAAVMVGAGTASFAQTYSVAKERLVQDVSSSPTGYNTGSATEGVAIPTNPGDPLTYNLKAEAKLVRTSDTGPREIYCSSQIKVRVTLTWSSNPPAQHSVSGHRVWTFANTSGGGQNEFSAYFDDEPEKYSSQSTVGNEFFSITRTPSNGVAIYEISAKAGVSGAGQPINVSSKAETEYYTN